MRNTIVIKAIFILIFVVQASISTEAQTLKQGPTKSKYTYIFKVSDKEAAKIFKNKIITFDKTHFHTLVDSFYTDSTYKNKLENGHYIKTYINDNKHLSTIFSVNRFEVYVLNNNTDLCLQLLDNDGNLLENAKLKIGNRKITFDKKTKSYIDKKSNFKGLLSVEVEGNTSYYSINRALNNSALKRTSNKIIYTKPMSYVLAPISFTVSLPFDAVISIYKQRAYGTISRTRWHFRRFINFLDGAHYNSSDYKGYFVLNKPKYLPNDTVKFKAYVFNNKGKAINNELDLAFYNNGKKTTITKLKPYNAGMYNFEFVLHDSLQLKLDKKYNLSLSHPKRNKSLSQFFDYEAYLLKRNTLTVRIENNEHYKGQNKQVFVGVRDDNNLKVSDARVEVIGHLKKATSFFDQNVFIPDTLFRINKKLLYANETLIEISDSLFPKANFEYELSIIVLNTDNEKISETKKLNYIAHKERFDYALQADSIDIKYLIDNKSVAQKVNIYASDVYGNKRLIASPTLPYKFKANALHAKYIFENSTIVDSLLLNNATSLIQCNSVRTNDSIIVKLINPRKIPVRYNIYKTNKEIARGYGDNVSLKMKNRNHENYYFTMSYIWGGKTHTENFIIPFYRNKLNIAVNQPEKIFPGEKTTIDLHVTNYKGKNVVDADITAFGLTKKFNHQLSNLPDLSKAIKQKAIINNFNIETKLSKNIHQNIDYDYWKNIARIDTIEYYRFLYPESGLYKKSYETSSDITQFAIFVVSKGTIVPIHVISLNSKPVYYSWSSNIRPYAFEADSGVHNITLRTSNNIITYNNLQFDANKKSIISIDIDKINNPDIKIYNAKSELSEYEKRLYYQYIIPYRAIPYDKTAYIESDKNNIMLLKPEGNNRPNYLAGPALGLMKFVQMNEFEHDFWHETFFEYEFLPKLIKMRTKERASYPRYLGAYSSPNTITDVLINKDSMIRMVDAQLAKKRISNRALNYHRYNNIGSGKLQFSTNNSDEEILNIALLKNNDFNFIQIYNGNTRTIEKLEQGYYKLIFFFNKNAYATIDSLFIKENGLNYFDLNISNKKQQDDFSIRVNNIIANTIINGTFTHNTYEQIRDLHFKSFKYTGDGEYIEGYVFEASTNEPIIGANVIITGTNYGAITNFDGYFSLKMPLSHTKISVNSIGFNSQVIDMSTRKTVNVFLEENELALEEIVVIGYGMQRKSSMTGSVAHVSNTLSGSVAGISIGNENVSIRGVGGIVNNNSPLIILNGEVYVGDLTNILPNEIESVSTLKNEDAVRIYGNAAANGVIIVNTKNSIYKEGMNNLDIANLNNQNESEQINKTNLIRTNFSDYAFWQPRLKTNKEGKVSFEVVFPDDITSWDTHFIALNNKRQTGKVSGNIKSYSPLSAQLYLPEFLVKNDSARIIGKIINYIPDSVELKSAYYVNDNLLQANQFMCHVSHIDTFLLNPLSDSVEVKYSVQNNGGYIDGEQRNVNVFPIGVMQNIGSFHLLNSDTTIVVTPSLMSSKTKLYVSTNNFDMLESSVKNLIKYPYNCNEQMASKIKALVAYKKICEYKKTKFEHQKELNNYVRTLIKNRNKNGLWGWWNISDDNIWISMHVLEALQLVESVDIQSIFKNQNQVTELLVAEFKKSNNLMDKINILRILKSTNKNINIGQYIAEIEKQKLESLYEKLSIIELKQMQGLKYSRELLHVSRKETLVGEVFFSDNNTKLNDLKNNDINNTILAYRILKSDSIVNKHELQNIRNYLIRNNAKKAYLNTYTSSQLITTIIDDLTNVNARIENTSITINADKKYQIESFPTELELTNTESISISKNGNYPLYLSVSEAYWDEKPTTKNNSMSIETYFENDKSALMAGKAISFYAKVKISKPAEYMMISIPIPAGCTYESKALAKRFEDHREYYPHQTVIFCNYLGVGEYIFEIKLLPKFLGKYIINPAKIESMYFPTLNSNNEVKVIEIH